LINPSLTLLHKKKTANLKGSFCSRQLTKTHISLFRYFFNNTLY